VATATNFISHLTSGLIVRLSPSSGTLTAGMGKSEKIRRPGHGLAAPPNIGLSNSLWRTHGWRLLTLWILVLAAYSNSFQADLLFDNGQAILNDPRIRSVTVENLRMIFTEGYWHFNQTSGLYRPFTTLSYLVNYVIVGNGANPAGYHCINLIVHAVNVSLVYILGIMILSQIEAAMLLAAMWGLHPLLTESVTNVVGRADALAAFGVLAGLLCYAHSRETQGQQSFIWLAGMTVAFTIGLFSKESGIVLIGLLILYDLAWPRAASFRERATPYLLLALPTAIFFLIRAQLHAPFKIEFLDNPMVNADFWTARWTAMKVIGKFLGLFVWPASLSADYSYDAIPLVSWREAPALLTAAITLAGAVAAFLWRREQSALFFFTGLFFAAIAPTSNVFLIIGSIGAERFMYLPALGLAGCVVVALSLLSKRQSMLFAAGTLCLALGVRTYARNADWRNEMSLWSSTVNASPGGARPHMNLGIALQHAGRLAEAKREYQEALRIYPNYAQAHYNYGCALAEDPERLPDAMLQFREAIRLEPEFGDAHNNLGGALAQIPGREEEAISEWHVALRFAPDGSKIHLSLAETFAKLPGRAGAAIAEYQAVLRAQPNLAEAHYNFGNLLSKTPGRENEALAEWSAAVANDPSLAQAHNNLANALARIPGRMPQAIAEWQAAVRYDPEIYEAHYNLGMALSRTPGRMGEAVGEYEAAFRLRPSPGLRQLIDQLRAGR
jgi:tetratricopeptide (TPR) repeat protein